MSDPLPRTADAVVIGAGIVGAACAHYLAEAGFSVVVVDRGPVSGGSTGAGEGNILVSDKDPGPELDLALLSRTLWSSLGAVLGARTELEPKGGLVVARTASGWAALLRRAEEQRAAGVDVDDVDSRGSAIRTSRICADDLVGGCYYPQDMQVQPMLAAAPAPATRAGRRAGVAGDGVRGARRVSRRRRGSDRACARPPARCRRGPS